MSPTIPWVKILSLISRDADTMPRATYYMVEMDYPHETAEEREAFDGFYHHHISMLLTIPGFLTAQRFQCPEAARAPFMAIYRLAGPEVMTSEAYTSKAGRMSVDPKFRPNMKNWDRNLVQGPEGTSDPDLSVPMGETMTLLDRLTAAAPPLPEGLTLLEVVGLDHTVAERGAALGDAEIATGAALPDDWEIRRWHPIHPVRITA